MYTVNTSGREPHPILNIALPLLLWVPLLVAIGYLVVHFAGDFAYYHPTLFGPFLPM